MNSKTKSLKTIITAVVFALMIIATGVLLASCGTPDKSTYKFVGQGDQTANVGEEIVLNNSLQTDKVGKNGYDKVLIVFEVNDKENLTIIAVGDNGQEYDITDLGTWGGEGFALPAEYNVSTEVRVTASQAGVYTFVTRLVDVENNNAVIVEATSVLTVTEVEA